MPENNGLRNRLKVLISAYACEPGKGSEPEIGWQVALQMARFHDVTVLTRANNRARIEAAGVPSVFPEGGRIRFVYFDLSRGALWLKKRLPFSNWYYLAWQKRARAVVGKLAESEHFDLLHHITYGSVRYPTAVTGRQVPCLWGPVGGVENFPWRMLPLGFAGSVVSEIIRNFSNGLQCSRWSGFKWRAKQFAGVIASTRETQACFHALGVPAHLLPAIGIEGKGDFPDAGRTETSGPLKLLFVGRLLFWKGLDLALHALALSGTTATLTLIGEGPFKKQAQALAGKLGVGGRVEFRGAQSRANVLASYREFDAMLHPSLHDSGAFVVLEAMLHGLPVICLDRGGPALAVEPGCGWKITPHRRAQTIRDLAEAIRAADAGRDALRNAGKTARASVIRRYCWDAQGGAMNRIYQKTVASCTNPTKAA